MSMSQLERVVYALIESQDSAQDGGAGTPLHLDDELIGELEDDWFKTVKLSDIDSDDLEDEMTSVIEQLEPDDPNAIVTHAYEVATGDEPLGWLIWIIDPDGDQGYVILAGDGVVNESGAGKYTLPDDWLED